MWRARRGTECFQPVLPLDNCAYVDGSAQHTYASGQHRLSFPCAFVPSVPYDGEVWLFIQFSAISSLVLSYFFLTFPSFSVSCPVLSFPLLFPFQFPFSFPFLFPFLSFPFPFLTSPIFLRPLLLFSLLSSPVVAYKGISSVLLLDWLLHVGGPSLAAPSACWVMIIKLKYPGTYQCITSLSTPQTHSYFRGYTGESVI